MTDWSDYRANAKARGALALELFVAHSVPAQGPDAVKACLPDHLAYQRRLEEVGQLALAGPLSDETGTLVQGAGMIVYRADTMEAARALADGDPMHAGGARTYTLRRWMINEGALTLSVGLSTGAVSLR